jgi:hypothetical protein
VQPERLASPSIGTVTANYIDFQGPCNYLKLASDFEGCVGDWTMDWWMDWRLGEGVRKERGQDESLKVMQVDSK